MANAFAALADPTRRTVFERLARGPASVSALAAGLPVTRPAISQHLKVLSEAGLVDAEPVGVRRIYRLRPEGVRAMRLWLDAIWTEALDAFAEAVEEEEDVHGSD